MVDSEAKVDSVDFVGVGRCLKGFEIDINDCHSERQVICCIMKNYSVLAFGHG